MIMGADFMENKADRYQKAVNIIDVLEQSPFAKIMKKALLSMNSIKNLTAFFHRNFTANFVLAT